MSYSTSLNPVDMLNEEQRFVELKKNLMCECIYDIEERLEVKLLELHPGANITEPVKLIDQALMYGAGMRRLYSPAVGQFVFGNVAEEFNYKVYYNHCPFCGEEYERI